MLGNMGLFKINMPGPEQAEEQGDEIQANGTRLANPAPYQQPDTERQYAHQRHGNHLYAEQWAQHAK